MNTAITDIALAKLSRLRRLLMPRLSWSVNLTQGDHTPAQRPAQGRCEPGRQAGPGRGPARAATQPSMRPGAVGLVIGPLAGTAVWVEMPRIARRIRAAEGSGWADGHQGDRGGQSRHLADSLSHPCSPP